MKRLVPVGRLAFGAFLLASGANHFFLSLWPLPTGHEPLAMQLMGAFVHSGLINVAMAIQLVAGVLLLAGLFVPLALCTVMPISVCAVYWALVLEQRPVGALLALAVLALNGLLMLAYLGHYRGALQRHALTLGETRASGAFFESVYMNPGGRTSRGHFTAALLVLLAVVVFYAWLVTGRTAHWCLLVLLFPAFVLHARRLHDMGHTAWLLLVPVALMLGAFGIWLDLLKPGAQLESFLPVAALVISAGMALWGCLGRGQPDAHHDGVPT